MGQRQTGAFVFVGDDTAVVDAGQLRHDIGLDREDVALGTTESVVRTCGDGGVTVAHIPLD